MAKKATARATTRTPAKHPPAAQAAPPAPAPTPNVNLALLAQINSATLQSSFVWCDPFDYQPLQMAGLIFVNETYANPDNPTSHQRAAQITAEGRAYLADHMTEVHQAMPQAAPSLAPTVTRARGLPIADKFKGAVLNTAPGALPPPKRGGVAREAQPTPLDDLQPGQAFDFPVSEEMPNPAKELAPIVSSANRKYTRTLAGEFETITETLLVVDQAGNAIIDPATGKQATQQETKQVAKKEHDRRFEMRSLHNDDGSLWGARVQRVK